MCGLLANSSKKLGTFSYPRAQSSSEYTQFTIKNDAHLDLGCSHKSVSFCNTLDYDNLSVLPDSVIPSDASLKPSEAHVKDCKSANSKLMSRGNQGLT